MTASLRMPRGLAWYGVLFAAWISAVMLVHGRYQYFGSPLPPVAFSAEIGGQLKQADNLAASIDELKKKAMTVQSRGEAGYTIHNIGVGYYDLYSITRNRAWLDSARVYFVGSAGMIPTVARFQYNLGRVLTEFLDHTNARRAYLATLAIEPGHIMALHNLGLLLFFENHQPDSARTYIERALAISDKLPIGNYVLGEIALDKKEYPEARARFEREIGLAAMNYGGGDQPARGESMAYAVAMSHINLAEIYSGVFPDRDKAQANLNAYLSMQRDPALRQEAIDRLKRYWVMQLPVNR